MTANASYDAFGNVVTQEFETTTPFGFSTKYMDSESGFLYYGFRFYDSLMGRWLSKDPIEEQGGLNLFGFLRNDGISKFDVLGKWGRMMRFSSQNWSYLCPSGQDDSWETLGAKVGLDPTDANLWVKNWQPSPWGEQNLYFGVPNVIVVIKNAPTAWDPGLVAARTQIDEFTQKHRDLGFNVIVISGDTTKANVMNVINNTYPLIESGNPCDLLDRMDCGDSLRNATKTGQAGLNV